MILLDTSVWIDHLRKRDADVETLLENRDILVHSFVIGEVALGPMKQYDLVIATLAELPQAKIAADTDVLFLIKQHQIIGTGIGYVDAHLLASAKLTPGTLLWTRDKRLKQVAEAMQIASALS